MSRTWQLQDAKNRFSEVVDEASRTGPQVITRRGKEAAVVLSAEQYHRLVEAKGRLIDVLRRAPKIAGGLEIERPTDAGRKLEL